MDDIESVSFVEYTLDYFGLLLVFRSGGYRYILPRKWRGKGTGYREGVVVSAKVIGLGVA